MSLAGDVGEERQEFAAFGGPLERLALGVTAVTQS